MGGVCSIYIGVKDDAVVQNKREREIELLIFHYQLHYESLHKVVAKCVIVFESFRLTYNRGNQISHVGDGARSFPPYLKKCAKTKKVCQVLNVHQTCVLL